MQNASISVFRTLETGDSHAGADHHASIVVFPGLEVSDTSLLWDRGEKLLAYARAGVPTHWILNLIDRQLEVFTSPDSSGYRARQILGPSFRGAVIIGGVEVGTISVADMLL